MLIRHIEYNTVCPAENKIVFDKETYVAAVIRSTAMVYVGENSFKAKPNTVIVLSDKTQKTISGIDCDLLIDAFEFEYEESDLFLRSFDIPVNKPMFGYDTFPLSNCIYELKKEFISNETYWEQMQNLLSTRFFILLKRLIDAGIHTWVHRLDNLRAQIINMPDKQSTIDEMVEIA